MIFFRDKTPSYRKTGAWERCSSGIEGPYRLSLARNLKGEKFNSWATAREKASIRETLLSALKRAGADIGSVYPPDVANDGGERRYSFIPFGDSPVYASLEEADHLHIEVFCTPENALTPEKAWSELNRIDSKLEETLEWSWTADLGYMTADHMSLGTGLHITGMFHLVGLKMFNDDTAVLNALERLRFQVEFCGKEAEAGEFPVYRITNAQTLGLDEKTIVARSVRIFDALREHEARARYSLMKEHPLRALQHVSSALSKLNASFLLSGRDCLILLTALNFGLNMGFLSGIKKDRLQALLAATQSSTTPGGGGEDDEFKRDICDRERAMMIQRELRHVRFSDTISAEWGLTGKF